MPDGQVPLQGTQMRLVEDLRDQTHVLVDDDPAAVGDRDPGRLLAAVLQRIQAEVGELGDLLPGGPHTKDTAGILRAFVV